MLDAVVAARQAEIEHRYGRRKGRKADYVKALRRDQVLRLIRRRHDGRLPNDEAGREALKILLALDLDGPTAVKFAAWAGPMIDKLAETEAKSREWRGDIAAMIGRRLAITAGEKLALRLSHLGCVDAAADAEAAKEQKRRARERDRNRKQRKRGSNRQIRNPLDLYGRPRCERAFELGYVVLTLQWQRIAQLCEAAKDRLDTFRGLEGATLTSAVHRAVRQLHRLGLAEVDEEPTATKLARLLVRLRLSPSPDQQDNAYEPEPPAHGEEQQQ